MISINFNQFSYFSKQRLLFDSNHEYIAIVTTLLGIGSQMSMCYKDNLLEEPVPVRMGLNHLNWQRESVNNAQDHKASLSNVAKHWKIRSRCILPAISISIQPAYYLNSIFHTFRELSKQSKKVAIIPWSIRILSDGIAVRNLVWILCSLAFIDSNCFLWQFIQIK